MSNAKLLTRARSLLETETTPELGPAIRPGVWPLPIIEQRLADATAGQALAEKAVLLRALVLLWHDHLDASHEVSQGLESKEGSYLHGLMHRREPDYENAKYWFRRVGVHPAFIPLRSEAGALLQNLPPTALNQMLNRKEWDPMAFIDAIAAATRRLESESDRDILRAIQAVEFRLLLEAICE